MAPDPKRLRARHPVGQELMPGFFAEDELQQIEDARSGDAFALVDMDIETQYCCPSCGYEWSGQPKPKKAEKES